VIFGARVVDMRIVLLGTNHPLQFGSGECGEEKVSAFREFICDICNSERIQLIAEEATEEGLKKYSVDQTVCAKVAAEMGVNHEMVDLLSTERFALGISDSQLIGMALTFQSDDEYNLSSLRSSFNRLSNQVREGVWVARTLLTSKSPVLLIVGADHIAALEELIKSIQQEAVIAHRDFDP